MTLRILDSDISCFSGYIYDYQEANNKELVTYLDIFANNDSLNRFQLVSKEGKVDLHTICFISDYLKYTKQISIIMFTTTGFDDDGKACEFFINFTKKNKEEKTAI